MSQYEEKINYLEKLVEDMVTHFNIPRSFERLRKKLTKPVEVDKSRRDLL